MTNYPDMLARANDLEPGRWNIAPGMGFNDTHKWWGDMGQREVAHNGIDLREYLYNDRDPYTVDGDTIVPVAQDGEIVCIIRDFLGMSVFVRHEGDRSGRTILTAYGHIVPDVRLVPGFYMVGGDAIGTVAGQGDDSRIPAHLHYSIVEADSTIDTASISWPMLEADSSIVFCDPLNTAI